MRVDEREGALEGGCGSSPNKEVFVLSATLKTIVPLQRLATHTEREKKSGEEDGCCRFPRLYPFLPREKNVHAVFIKHVSYW